jgi:hypothetical protein
VFVLLLAPTARSGTRTHLQQREHRQVVSLHRYVCTVTFFQHHPRLAHTAVGRRELRKARIWIAVIRRELAETRAQLRPRPSWPIPSWFRSAALCVHNGESRDWHILNPPYANGMQFTLQSWTAVGGSSSTWQWASPAEQLYRAYRLWLIQGWGAWPNTSRACGLR